MSAFDRLKGQIEKKEGISDKRAAAITASIGRKKLGEKEMARRSVAGREKHKESKTECSPVKMERRTDGSYSCPSTWEGTFREQMKNLRYGPDSDKPAGKLPHTAEMTEGE